MQIAVIAVQEWELFTGLIVADVKEGARHGEIPGWVEEDRAQAVSLLKVWYANMAGPVCLCG